MQNFFLLENKNAKKIAVLIDPEKFTSTEDFIQKMESGIEIMGKKTLPCTVIPCENNSFKIILVQGLNRQIRRMCYKLNYEVLSLKRIRIGRILLGELQSNHYFSFDKKELFD